MIGSGAPYPGFWRSPAIVENLALALDGPAPAGPWASLLPRAREALASATETPPGVRPRPQRAVHRALRDLAASATPLHVFLRTRLQKFFFPRH
eukprot:5695657-Pyramimonas_sp.AAC.1